MKKLTIVFALIGLISALFATTMTVHTTTGEQEFEISEIENITFSNNSNIIFQEDFNDWNATIWDGQSWSGNNPSGAWQPQIENGIASFQTDDYSWGMIKTTEQWNADHSFTFTFTPYLESGGTNVDVGFLGISSNWLFYEHFGENVSVGFKLIDGTVNVWLEHSSSFQSEYASLGSYTPGVEIILTLTWNSDGSVLLVNGNNQCLIDAIDFPTNSVGLVLGNANSPDGLDVNQVIVE